MQEISDIIRKMPILRKYYDCVRVLDPFKMKTLSLIKADDTKINLTYDTENCYTFWHRGHSCKNCIAKKAASENAAFVKIEASGDKIYMVTALPVNYQNTKYVLELIKDVTDKKDFLASMDSFGKDINPKILQDAINRNS
ncbi:hypothetical protein [Dendrosporobacter sp. 1207_IL3150]|uniref:hypothetical protein n=1 Tax=Dendrosporobacter sp. 1207_IL3150 TaxID=3084054 RepID=UPI002FD9D81E